LEFLAIDVETANERLSSICQIGIVTVKNSLIVEEWKSYVDPETHFNALNVAISGINEEIVKGAPKFPELSETLKSFLEGQVVVSHTRFDSAALYQASGRYGLNVPKCTWLDSAQVARRTWKEFSKSGYGLKNLCQMLGYDFEHHDALEDARAAAYVILEASKAEGFNVDDWLSRVRKPIDPTSNLPIRRDGNPEGSFSGEVLVFTGALMMTRRDAADLADKLGCKVDDGVTKRTTILVVGDQDLSKLAGQEKSNKHRKAEKLVSQGQEIRIIGETDFMDMIQILD